MTVFRCLWPTEGAGKHAPSWHPRRAPTHARKLKYHMAKALPPVLLRLLLLSSYASLAQAKLAFESSSSSILFDNNARITASCQNPAPSSQGSPTAIRVAPLSVATMDRVRVRFKNVALSCAITDGNEPCALPLDPLDHPGWYCNFNSSLESYTYVGPFHGTVTRDHNPNVTDADIHAAYTSPCATACHQRPASVLATLECPIPEDLRDLNVSLQVSYHAPLGGRAPGAVAIPYAPGVRHTISVLPPSLPLPPPPSPPPPAMPPPVMYRPWYRFSLGCYKSSPGVDSGIRGLAVYMDGTWPSYTWSIYKQACLDHGVRAWADDDATNTYPGGDGILHINRGGASCNIGGHDMFYESNLQGVMKGTSDGDGGHAGYTMMTRQQMLDNLKEMGVPAGMHRMMNKQGHGGEMDANAMAAKLEFTINSAFTDFSSVTNQNSVRETCELVPCAISFTNCLV